MKKIFHALILALLFAGECFAAAAETTTPNLGLTLPFARTDSWGSKLNQNFTILDSKFPGGQGGHRIADEGSLLINRPTLNFIGAEISCVDNPISLRTDCTLFGGGTPGLGTVTSVAVSVPAFLSVTGSPVTTAGTIAIGLSGQALPITSGGTGAITALQARTNLGISTPVGSSILMGNGVGGFNNAVAGTHYAPATSGTSILKASAGGFANATPGADYESPLTFSSPLSRSGNTISCPTCGSGGGGSGNVSTTGSPVAGQVAVMTSANTITGYAGFTFDNVTGQLHLPTTGGFAVTYGHDTLTANRTVTSPDNNSITVSTSGLAATSNQFVTGIDSGSKALIRAQPSFTNLSGTATDAQIPDLNSLSTGLTASRCVRTNVTGGLAVAAGDCNTGGGGGTPAGSNNTMQVNNAGAFAGYDEFTAYQTTQDTSSAGPRIIIQPYDSIPSDRTMTIPVGGDSTAVRPTTCTGGQKISAINADGSVTCS